jgi:hypothetical protein
MSSRARYTSAARAKPVIRRVYDPGVDPAAEAGGDYALHVLLDMRKASSDLRPFHTTLADFPSIPKGLLKEYGGGSAYVLVAVDPAGDDETAEYIFRRLPGNKRVQKSKGTPSRIPEKYRDQITRRVTKTDLAKPADPLEPGSSQGLVFSETEETEGTGIAVRTDVEEVIDENGAPLDGLAFAPNGTAIATSERIVPEGTQDDKGVNIVNSEVSPLGGGLAEKRTVTARKRVVTQDSDTYVEGHPQMQTKSKGVPNLIPEKYRGQIATVQTTTQHELDGADINDIPEPDAPTGDQSQIVHEKVNDERYQKVVVDEVIDENADPLEGAQTGTWGVEGTKELLVVEGDDAESGFGVKSGKVVPLGNGKAVRATEFYPDVLSENLVYTLEGQENDEETASVIDIERSLVNASAAKTLATTKREQGWFVEIQPLDKWHSIMIGSKIVALPEPQTWTTVVGISLPDKLTGVGVIWDADFRKDAATAGIAAGSLNKIKEEGYSWDVSAEAVVVGSVTGRPYTKVEKGYRGPAAASVTRTFFSTPPTQNTTIHAFKPVFGYISIRGEEATSHGVSRVNGVGDTRILESKRLRFAQNKQLVIHSFGPIEHSNPSLQNIGTPTLTDSQDSSGGSVPGGGLYPVIKAQLTLEKVADLELPSSSSPLTSGQQFVQHVEVKHWRAGVWIREVYTATVP